MTLFRTFKSTGVKDVRGDAFTLVGNLSMHGVTREVTLDVTSKGRGKDLARSRSGEELTVRGWPFAVEDTEGSVVFNCELRTANYQR